MAELATVARPYAEAAYQVARLGDVAAWGQQVQVLAQVAANADIRAYADNPKVEAGQVFDVVVAAASQTLSAGVANFLQAVIENGRLALMPEIAQQFQALVNAAGGVSQATIFSAYPLEDAQLAEAVEALEQRFSRKLEATVVVEPELIGGIRVVVGDEVLDTSVRARLDRMRAVLSA